MQQAEQETLQKIVTQSQDQAQTQYKKAGELVRLTNNQLYQVEKLINHGSQAEIYLAIQEEYIQEEWHDHKRVQPFALKVFSKRRLERSRMTRRFFECEVNVLRALKNPHIVQLIATGSDETYEYLLFEYCNQGDLFEKLNNRLQRHFEEEEALGYFYQLLLAMQELQSTAQHPAVVHRDIKLENILLHNGQVKLCDFGFADFMMHSNELKTTQCGAPLTMAPEVLRHTGYNLQADIYSLGVVLHEMLTGYLPFTVPDSTDPNTQHRLLALIKKGPLNLFLNTQIRESTKVLVQNMLRFEPSERPNLQHIVTQCKNLLTDNTSLTTKYDMNHRISGSESLVGKTSQLENDMNKKNQYLIEIIPQNGVTIKMLGDYGVGKTSIVRRYYQQQSEQRFQQVTIGQEFYQKEESFFGHSVRLTVVDTQGQEKYQGLPKSFYNLNSNDGPQGFIIVFDLTSISSLHNTAYWIDSIRERIQYSAPILIVGNKKDLFDNAERLQSSENRSQQQDKLVNDLNQCPYSNAENCAKLRDLLRQKLRQWKEQNIHYRATCAIDGYNVNIVFNKFMAQIIELYAQEQQLLLANQSGQNTDKDSEFSRIDKQRIHSFSLRNKQKSTSNSNQSQNGSQVSQNKDDNQNFSQLAQTSQNQSSTNQQQSANDNNNFKKSKRSKCC